MARIEGHATTIDVIFGDPGNAGLSNPSRVVFTYDVADAGFQATPEQYTDWLGLQLQNAHDQVWLSSELRANGDPAGDLRPGFYKETSPGIYTEVPEDQARIIIEGNGPNRTVTARGIIYTVTWDGEKYVVHQQKIRSLL
jgi:hypothetical protein